MIFLSMGQWDRDLAPFERKWDKVPVPLVPLRSSHLYFNRNTTFVKSSLSGTSIGEL